MIQMILFIQEHLKSWCIDNDCDDRKKKKKKKKKYKRLS